VSEPRHRVVIVGGGFAGLRVARGLRGAPVDLTLIDRRNFHLFQPLLYQVATGGLSPAEICAPLRAVMKGQKNATVLLDEVTGFDPAARRVILSEGELAYDTLVVATGVRHHYFGHPEWEARAPGLKTVEDATEIRSRTLDALERAERATGGAERAALLTFVVVGGGPTGVELAGAIAELTGETVRGEFRHFDPSTARILLVEGEDRLLPPYHPAQSASARRTLEALGVEVLTGTRVTAIDRQRVTLQRGGGEDGEESTVEAATVLWAAGVRASGLGARLAESFGAETDRAGRVRVEADCTLPGHPEIYVLGDLAALPDGGGKPLPGVAPVAMQQGHYAAKAIRRRLAGRPLPAFRYRDKGSLAVIGRAAAVADLGFLRLSGLVAWLLWLFIHILYLVGFSNRLLVLIQWAYSYLTRGRGARIIANSEVAADSGPPPA
jgi:NADH dehydrogenase